MARAAEPLPTSVPRTALQLWWVLGLPLALCVASLAAFWPCVHQGFVALDDDANFELNHLFRGLGPEQIDWMFTGYHYGHWHPLTWLTFGLDYELYGLDGAAYHRTNLALHALSVLAVYSLAVELLRWIAGWASGKSTAGVLDTSRSFALHVCAAIATASWALHPLRVESVAWATERRDLLSTMFLALTVLAYLRMCRFGSHRVMWLTLALVAYALSLLSKAWGMTLPVILLALDVFPLRRIEVRERASWLKFALEKAWFVPFAFVAAYQAAAAQRAISAAVSLGEHTIFERVAQASYGLCFYVVKTLWPTNLSCHYLLELDFRPTAPIYLAAMATVATLSIVLVLLRSRFPAGLATWFAYGVLVSPVLGILQSGAQKVADRYAHLSSMPFSFLLGGILLVWLARRDGARRRTATWGVLAITLLLGAMLGVASNAQTRVWRDSESLFRRAAEVEPDNYFVLHNLSVSLYRRQAYEEALEVEARSVAAHPGKGNEEARYTLGLLHSLLGRQEQAEAAWREALEVEPTHQNSLNALKSRLIGRGDVEGAIQLFERTVERAPTALSAHLELDQLYTRAANSQKSIAMWERAEARGGLPRGKVDVALARAYAAAKRFKEAETRGFRAALTEPEAKSVLDALASAAGNFGAGVEFWERARRAYVPAPMVENGLGKLHLAAGRLAEAEAHLLRAQLLDNQNKDYVVDVCELFLRQGRSDDALRNAQAVLAVDPTFARAREMVGRVRAGDRSQ